MSRELLTALREQVRRIERPAAVDHGVAPFGIAAIDRVLPGGGLMRGAVHEILGLAGDEEDGALAAAFASVILARLTADEGGVVLWCLPWPDLYGPGLAAHGFDPARLVLVRARRDDDLLWAMEEGLRAPGVTAVVGEISALAAVASRRLQLAAERSGVTALLLRRWRSGDEAARQRDLPSAAATRWRITALPSRPVCTRIAISVPPRPLGGEGWGKGVMPMVRRGDPLTPPARGQPPPIPFPARRGGSGWGPGIGQPCWRVELLRCRGGQPAAWEVEVGEGKAADATNPLSVAEALADRPDAPRRATAHEKLRRTG
jgi:protein ImuA